MNLETALSENVRILKEMQKKREFLLEKKRLMEVTGTKITHFEEREQYVGVTEVVNNCNGWHNQLFPLRCVGEVSVDATNDCIGEI